MAKSPPSSAEDLGSISDWGTKIPHAKGQLSPWASQLLILCAATKMLQLRPDAAK